jgi:hypothetical protein
MLNVVSVYETARARLIMDGSFSCYIFSPTCIILRIACVSSSDSVSGMLPAVMCRNELHIINISRIFFSKVLKSG